MKIKPGMNSQNTNNPSMINVGLIGFGMGGRIFHAPLITYVEGLRLVKIRETRDENIRVAKQRYPGVKIVSDAMDILEDPEIDLVIVAVPNKFHFSLAKEALERDKHVVVEKPFTVTPEQGATLVALAERCNKILSVYHNRRWDSDFRTVREVINSGKLGRLVEYEAHYDRFRNTIRPATWKEEGSDGTGLLYDLGSHLIDQALVLFGMPEAVTAFTAMQRDQSRIVDNFEVLLHYPALKVTLKSGMLVKATLPKYILLGTEGSFVKSGLDVQESDLDAGKKALTAEDWGREPNTLWGQLTYGQNGNTYIETVESLAGDYPAFYRNIRDAILGRDELIVTPGQACNTIRIIELARQSQEEKKTISLV